MNPRMHHQLDGSVWDDSLVPYGEPACLSRRHATRRAGLWTNLEKDRD